MPDLPFGFLAVDKPPGMTSHDVVAKVRRGIGIKRIGHAGTLDPMATGALILCVGAATRLSEYVMASRKTYVATLRLGVETDTYDADGQVTATHPADQISEAELIAALSQFQGEIDQIPPMYSAIKQAGKKLYELARAGQEVERAPRRVWIAVQVAAVTLPDVTLTVTCSAGTYIRSLAHDLGAALGVGAHLTALRRTRSGHFADLVPWDVLIASMADGTWHQYLVDERLALPHIPELSLSQTQADDVIHGRRWPAEAADPPLVRAYDPSGRFVAILEKRENTMRPVKVFLPGDAE